MFRSTRISSDCGEISQFLAIPVYFVEERRMQMLLPFHSSNGRDISCFLVERDDHNHLYKIKGTYPFNSLDKLKGVI